MNEFNKKHLILKEARYVGVDLAKNVFGVVVSDRNKTVLKKKMIKRHDFIRFIEAELPKDITIFVEGCGTSQFWGRELSDRGFDIKIVPAQHAKPFVQMGKKNDLNDAFAIIEAGLRDGIKFIPVKSELQRELSALVTRRSQLMDEKIRLQNQIHALFRENGIPLRERQTTIGFAKEANSILENLKVPYRVKLILSDMLEELMLTNNKIQTASLVIEKHMEELKNEESETGKSVKNMLSVYGVGPITVATLVGSVGDMKQFKSGRQLSAFLGLTPRQFSSGGKSKLGSITKHGNAHLRSLLVLCSHAFLIKLEKLDPNSPLVKWIKLKMKMMEKKKLVVALANKLARILWAVSVKNEQFSFN